MHKLLISRATSTSFATSLPCTRNLWQATRKVSSICGRPHNSAAVCYHHDSHDRTSKSKPTLETVPKKDRISSDVEQPNRKDPNPSFSLLKTTSPCPTAGATVKRNWPKQATIEVRAVISRKTYSCRTLCTGMSTLCRLKEQAAQQESLSELLPTQRSERQEEASHR